MKVLGNSKVDELGILNFGESNESCDDTVYDIENSFIKHFKVMAFLEFIRMSHILKVVKSKDNVLDIGCGYGHYGYCLYTNMYSVDYVGIDLNYKHLARASARQWGNSKHAFIQKDITRGLPFEDNSFEVILFIQVIEHLTVKQTNDVLKECYRVLKPKGTMVLATENNKFTVDHGLDFHIHEYQYEELFIAVIEAGFEVYQEFGLLQADNIRNIPDCPEKRFLQGRHFKMLSGIGEPQTSKYIVFDLKK